MRCVLVEPRRKTDPIGKCDAHDGDRRGRQARCRELCETDRGGGIQAAKHESVRRFGIDAEQQWTEQRIQRAHAKKWARR